MAVDDGVTAGLRRMGVSEADIEALQCEQAAPPELEFEVYEDCWESVLFFLRVQTQWVYQGLDGRRAGLNNTAVESTMRMTGVRKARQGALLDDLQEMERAVLMADAQAARGADVGKE